MNAETFRISSSKLKTHLMKKWFRFSLHAPSTSKFITELNFMYYKHNNKNYVVSFWFSFLLKLIDLYKHLKWLLKCIMKICHVLPLKLLHNLHDNMTVKYNIYLTVLERILPHYCKNVKERKLQFIWFDKYTSKNINSSKYSKSRSSFIIKPTFKALIQTFMNNKQTPLFPKPE